MPSAAKTLSPNALVRALGAPDLPPHISPFDPGYDAATVVAHLEQSGHLMSRLKLSMACWLIADEGSTRKKIAAARRLKVPLVTGGGPFEIAQDLGLLARYLELCGSMGIERIEAGEGFTKPRHTPNEVCSLAAQNGLTVQIEVGEKHAGAFDDGVVDRLIDRGREWLDAGAKQIVVEGRESAQGVGLFDDCGKIGFEFAEAFVNAWGMDITVFEAPTKKSQFELLDHFGPRVNLSNVRLEEVLRVEIYRRGLHSDAYGVPALRPRREGKP